MGCRRNLRFQASETMSSSRDHTPILHKPYMVPFKKRPWHKDKMFYFNLIHRSLAEFLGTSLFVFTAVSALSNMSRDSEGRDYDPSSVAVTAGLAQGLAYGALVAAMSHVSGGHLNPAVTVGVLVAGGINIVAALCYLVAQLVGGIVGAACVLAYDSSFSNDSALDYGITQLQPHIHPSQGILIELLLSILLVMVFVHTTMERSEFRSVAPVVIGLALTAAIVSSYSLTGGSMNPARSFGPAVVSPHSHRWNNHYVYWLGPLLGGVLAGVFYRLILSPKPLIPITEPDSVPRSG